MSKEALIEIIDRLIGDYEPIGETNHDDNSNNNLDLLCDLVYHYIRKIYFLIPNKNRVEYSIKTSGEIAENMFNILFEDFFENREKENEISVIPVSDNSTISLTSGSVKFPDNVTITQINNDIGHGVVTGISSVTDPNLKVVGSKDETDFVATDPPTPPLDMSHVKLPTSLPITYTNIPWITEGEPDETGDYLITVEDEYFSGDRYVEIETYYKDEPNNGFANYEDGDSVFGAGWQTIYKVLAWAPIMIYPYYDKEEKENEMR